MTGNRNDRRTPDGRSCISPKDDPSDYINGEYSRRTAGSRRRTGWGMLLLVLILLALLMVSVCLNVYALERLQYYSAQFDRCSEWMKFMDENVVFVEDDGSPWYHRYSCDEFGDSAFWAFNTEAAVDYGYRPCPDCHE